MSLDHLPARIEQGVQRYADEFRISHDEALIKILETGLSAIGAEIVGSARAEIVESRLKRDAKRESKVEVLARNAADKSEAVFGHLPTFRGFGNLSTQ